jgi:hypothetical protein
MHIRFFVWVVPLGMAAGLLWALPPLLVPETAAAPTQGIDIARIETEASKTAVRSFDDGHQMYLGVLDVLRTYEGPEALIVRSW